jgi:hypothetical protein
VLVYLRKGETYTELAVGFGVSVATASRYVEETVALLRARAPKLDRAFRNAARDGLHYLVLDGMIIPTLADKGYQGAEGLVSTPYKGRNKPLSQKAANRSQRSAPTDRANAPTPAQELAHPPQVPLLPAQGRPAMQGDRRPLELRTHG